MEEKCHKGDKKWRSKRVVLGQMTRMKGKRLLIFSICFFICGSKIQVAHIIYNCIHKKNNKLCKMFSVTH